jgi:hypothetical protein
VSISATNTLGTGDASPVNTIGAYVQVLPSAPSNL